ncbi:helix-turn-helix domain-containing protein [Humibacillus xanthopallidus]|uniref:AraC family transcriptional regulator n=1 Tax=Humibacillus xanthopallidus TaxID=412689 RepID=A0A543HGF7_9MICO|nr:helix-turn-helix domain-containing protein [Humibacillus xanthopallidus]TQM57373.1 AraC family transcriptional regulator [Humibacillus xanthopallidus]
MATGSGAPVAATRDDIERAHLLDPHDRTWSIARADVAPDLADVARRFWIPVWDVPDGEIAPQKVLQYPVCLIVISGSYTRFYGVVSGLSQTVLSGRGWAVGLMLQPAAGHLLTRAPVRRMTDRFVDLTTLDEHAAIDGTALTAVVREIMTPDPGSDAAQAQARSAVEAGLRRLLPVDEEGLLVNAIVEDVETSPDLLRVDELCARFDVSERTLQRLLHKRIGLGPKWLIRRRRLQEAADRLRDADAALAGIAADLGYADQAHFTRDFRKATGLTPGEFAARFR